MTKYVFVNGGTKKQRALVEDVAGGSAKSISVDSSLLILRLILST